MASFLSCRSSCCDYNVLRLCSYILSQSYSLASHGKVYLITERGVHSFVDSYSSNTNRQFRKSMGLQSLRLNSSATFLINNNTSKTFLFLPVIYGNTITLNSPVSKSCSYHTNRCDKSCCYINHGIGGATITTCCSRHLRQLRSPCFYRCFSVGRKNSHTHYYDILGLSSKASQKQIKTAYYDLSKKYHPDVTNDKKSHILFTEINEAYEVLGNIQKRRMYDKGMFSHRDQRVYDESDYTESYKKKASESPFERGNRPPPPTGRSKIYNFDEFYKQHYNDMRERRKQEYDAFLHYKKMNRGGDGSRNTKMSSPLLLSVCFTLFVIVIILNEQLFDRDSVKGNGNGKE